MEFLVDGSRKNTLKLTWGTKVKHVLGDVAPSPCMSFRLLHYKYIRTGANFFSQASHIMDYFTLSMSVPSPRASLWKAILWASRCFRWRNVEISSNCRETTKLTLEVDRTVTPAVDLRRCARLREGYQPSTMSILWTNSSNITTSVAVWVEHQ